MTADPGTCGFCGRGDGRFGETGDETSRQLEGAVRSGTPGEYTYELHPNAIRTEYGAYTVWCGRCDEGLAHKFQRYDDLNLGAEYQAHKLQLELDPLRWARWTDPSSTDVDDPAIHIRKLSMSDNLRHYEREIARRAK
jgi:hypothetical protein